MHVSIFLEYIMKCEITGLSGKTLYTLPSPLPQKVVSILTSPTLSSTIVIVIFETLFLIYKGREW